MARIRETFNGKDAVAHAWSRQDQERGREADKTGGRIFFEGPTIYSYGRHFPIATFYQRKGKEKIVLFTKREYSPTTSAHMGAARGAVSHHRIIYCESPTDAESGNHGDNMRHWESAAQSLALKLSKATKPEKYLSQIANLRREMQEYAEYFSISKLSYKATGGKLTRFRYLMIESKEGGTKATAKEIAARKKYEKEFAAKRAKAEAKAIQEFRDWKSDHVRESEWSFLRMDPNSGDVQTSKGIQFGRSEAKEYYFRLKRFQSKVNNGEDIKDNLDRYGMEFEGYTLRTITADHFEIGCHKIQFSELDRLAKAAGFTMQAMTKEG
jgi:hypothetical protein